MKTFIQIVKTRLSECSKCPSLSKGFISTCKECGCALKVKALVKTETCPLNKWES